MLPSWVLSVARWQVAAAALVIAVPAAFVATVVPYRHWDSMAFGLWSKLIATTGEVFPEDGVGTAMLHRPLFYVAQGLGWRWLDDGEWVGRWLSLLFGAAFVWAVWWLAGRLTSDADASTLLRPLAASMALASSAIALHLVAGLSDLPVAACAALTAVAFLSRLRALWRLPLVALASCSTMLAKPTGFVALAGVALAGSVLLLPAARRSVVSGLAAFATGTAAGLGYHLVQANRLGISLADELSSGNSEVYLERGAAARTDALLHVEWLGEGLRLVVLAGVLFSVARVAGARPRVGLAVAGPGAIALSLAGPLAADGRVPYPFAGPSWLGVIGWLGMAAILVGAAVLAERDPLTRRAHAALLAWLAPGAAVWLAYRSDEVRFLSPAWPSLVLLASAVLGCGALALARARPWLALAPFAAVTMLVIANATAVDGLGRDGFGDLLEQGRDAWSDPVAMESFAYGPFADELAYVRRTIGNGGDVVSSDARLSYFFPGRAPVMYAGSCAELAEARAFVLLLGDESVEFMERVHGSTADPLAWEQCAAPRLYPVGSQDGIYAVYAVGARPIPPAAPESCRVTATPGQLLDGVFVDGVPYAEAKALRTRAAAVGYRAARIERVGCGSYRVVVTGIPTPQANQDDFLRESSSVGFDVEIREAIRYPEVPPAVEPAPARR